MDFSFIRKTLATALLSLTAVGGMAQDLIARQAPSDKRLKDIHNVKLHSAAITADLENPAADIYTDWTENIRKCSGHVPANFKIDLRNFCMPTTNRKINSLYGRRWGRQHEGLDIKVYIGDTIRSAFDGKVRICKYNGGGYGYYIVIRHTNGLETLYGHLSKQIVKENQVVRAGDPIGLGGNTGRSSGSHLHFETRLLGEPINPALLFDFENQDMTGDFYSVRNGSVTKGHVAASRSINQIDAENEKTNVTLTAENAQTNNDAVMTSSPDRAKTEKPVSHAVKSGDTLFSIARKYGTTVDKLCKLNGIKKSAVLRKGQVLRCS